MTGFSIMDYLSCLLSCHLTDCIREALAEPGTLCLLKKEFLITDFYKTRSSKGNRCNVKTCGIRAIKKLKSNELVTSVTYLEVCISHNFFHFLLISFHPCKSIFVFQG